MAASTLKLKSTANQLQAIESIDEMAIVLKIKKSQLALLSVFQKYEIYKIPKRNGGFRTIENPHPSLKMAQSKLNDYFQCYYALIRPQNVYGFCISTSHSKLLNIKTNAEAHIGKPWMLNIDLQDFFHHISENWVNKILNRHFNGWDNKLVDFISHICTFNHRLPMGAPTSPVLSNLACFQLDEELIQFSNYANITCTRFADDFTFSSNHEITHSEIELILSIIRNHGFIENKKKVQRFSPSQTKIVTGLVVGNEKVELPTNYLPQLKIEIGRLATFLNIEQRYNTGMSHKKLKLFKQELAGKINFASSIIGSQHPEIENIESQYLAVIQPSDTFESIDWLDIPYSVF